MTTHTGDREYYFNSSNFNITGAHGLAILAPDPVTIWFAAGPAGVNITDAVNLSLGNWTIDYILKDDAGNAITNVSDVVAKKKPGITLNLLNCTAVTIVRNAFF